MQICGPSLQFVAPMNPFGACGDSSPFRHGGIDIVFANAGISGGLAGLFEQSSADWEEILRVNLIGPWLAIKYAAPHMKTRGGGSIICTASVAGIRAGAGGPAYSASKAGVINLVKVAAVQLCESNIRVNAICPGLIETGMTQGIYDMLRSDSRPDTSFAKLAVDSAMPSIAPSATTGRPRVTVTKTGNSA